MPPSGDRFRGWASPSSLLPNPLRSGHPGAGIADGCVFADVAGVGAALSGKPVILREAGHAGKRRIRGYLVEKGVGAASIRG